MARNTGTFNFAANLEGLAKSPIDARQQVGTYADLTTPATWNASGSVWLYDGAIVAVSNDIDTSKNGIYYLRDAANYTGATSWVQLASAEATSGDTTYNEVWMSGETETGLTLKEWYDVTQSAGRISGGTITEASAGTVDVAAGAGLIKDGTGRTDQNRYVTWNSVSALALSTGYNFIYYDAENKAIQATTDSAEILRNDNFNVGRVYYDSQVGTVIRLCGQNLWNLNRRLHLYGDQVWGVQRASGMAISSTSGLTFQVSGGVLWAELLNRFTTNDFDSITTDFNEWYYDGTNWITVPVSDGNVNNSLYNNPAGGLASLTAGYYTIRWVYVVHDSSVHVVYEDAEYTGQTEALNAQPRETLPTLVDGFGTLVGRIIVQEGNTNIVDISTAFGQFFATQSVQAHNELSGIQGGQAGEYYHLTATESTNINDIPDMKEVTDIAVTGATNGLTKYDAHNVALGGTLTGDTEIDIDLGDMTFAGSANQSYKFGYLGMNLAFNGSCIYLTNSGNDFLFRHRQGKITCVTNSGLTYGGDYSSSFIGRSLVDKDYVDSCVTGATGAIDGANGLDRQGDNIVLGGTLTGNTTIGIPSTSCLKITGNTADAYLDTFFDDGAYCSCLRSRSGAVCLATNLNASSYSGLKLFSNNALLGVGSDGTASNNSLCFTSNNATLVANSLVTISGGSDVCIESSGNILFNAPSGATYAGAYRTNFTDLSLVDKCYVDTCVAGIEGNAITGATNGLCKTGQDVYLGGSLTENTTICGGGGTYSLSLGTSAGSEELDVFSVYADGICLDSVTDFNMNVTGGTITTSGGEGLRYGGAYESSFVDASLVSKCYVDTVATGLQPHDTVLVATTTNIVLSGTSTIDGVAVTAGDRVLVKNQTSGATNGIYDVAAGVWSRSEDFDGTPVGEVVNGDLVPVESGDTYANTIWVLTTPDPITVGTTALDFTLFSKLLGVSAGDGIDITPVGSTQQIAVDLAANGGLCITATELQVNDSIAGDGLTWTSGVVDVNATGTATGTCIDIALDVSDNLVIGGNEITNAIGQTGPAPGTAIDVYDATGLLVVGSDDITANIAQPTPTGTLIDVYDNSGLLVVQASDIQAQMTGNTFTNGLCEVGGEVCLGGTLTENTIIDLNSLYAFSVESGNYGLCIDSDGNPILGNITETSQYTCFGAINGGVFNANPLNIVTDNANISTDNGIHIIADSSEEVEIGASDSGVLCLTAAGNVFTDNTAGNEGIVYAGDYETTFADRSLVTKQYVTSQVSGITNAAITGATNGVTKDGQDVVLGGDIIQSTLFGLSTDSVLYTGSTPSFKPGTGFDAGTVRTIRIQPSGKILVGGNGSMTSYTDATGTYNIDSIARFNSDYSFDTSFYTEQGFASTPWGMETQSDGKIVIGSDDLGTYTYLVRLNSDGTIDTGFAGNNQPNGTVYDIVTLTGGKLLLFGDFTTYSGVTVNHIVVLNADGTIDNTFNTGTGFTSGTGGIPGTHVAVQSDGKIIIVGEFTSYSGSSVGNIIRLNTDGTIDNTFNGGTVDDTWAIHVAVQPTGKILLGGNFTTYSGVSANYVIRLNSDGSIDNTFDTGGATGGFDDYTRSFFTQDDGKILVGGGFNSFSGVTANYIVRLNDDGSIDDTYNSGTGFFQSSNQAAPHQMVEVDEGIIFGGGFTSYNAITVNRIVILKDDGIIYGGEIDFRITPSGLAYKNGTERDDYVLAGDSEGNMSWRYNSNITGWNDISNISIGCDAMPTNTQGTSNIAIGRCAYCHSGNTGISNIAIGSTMDGSLSSGPITGSYNTALGSQNLIYATSASFNVAIGRRAAQRLTTGTANIAIGCEAMWQFSTGVGNTVIGHDALASGTALNGNYNVVIGHAAGCTRLGTINNELIIANNASTCLISGSFTGKTVTIDNKLITDELQITSGATDNYVLTSDASGNATWQAAQAGLGSITGATNGIGYTAQQVCLGAPLTDDVILNGTNNEIFYIQCVGSFGLNVNDENTPNFNFEVHQGSVVSTGARLSNQNTNTITSITLEDTLNLEAGSNCIDIGTTSIDVTGAVTMSSTLDVSGNTSIGGTLAVDGAVTLNSVASGSTTDEVLTITTGGEVQKISADSLGEDNNIYTISGITANTTLDNTYYTVLADSTGGAFTITLPAAPDQGQAYKIKDAGGNALTNNITISGNGNNIDGSASASINTDYGALELAYDSTEDAWFALSFVN